MKFMSCFFILYFCAGAAASVPPGFDQASYQNLLQTTAAKGDKQVVDGTEWRVLTEMTPNDPTKPHHADYIGVLGPEVRMESEIWTLDGKGNWNIEQWSWSASEQGDLIDLTHALLIETRGGSVLDLKGLPAGQATEPAELARWNAKLSEWYGFLKK